MLDFVDCTARLSYSIYMGKIISIITNNDLGDDSQRQELLRSSIILSVLILVSYCASNWEYFLMFINAGKARLTITGLLYKKLNMISLTSLHEFKIGKAMNLIANDLNDVDNGASTVPTMIMCPYMITLGTYIMWEYFGPSCLIGLFSSIGFLVGQIYLSNKTGDPRKENKRLTDERVKYTNELIENIRLLKMYAWEKPFKENIENLREKEYKTFMKIVYIDALGRNLSIISAYLSILLVSIAFIYLGGGILSPDKIYASMIVLSFLSTGGLMYFHHGKTFLINFKLILGRVQEIMTIPEVSPDKTSLLLSAEPTAEVVVFKDFTGYWNKMDTKSPCLKEINLALKPGTLTTVIGRIGSGKTTLLFSMLKELPLTRGTLETTGKIAYVEQEPIIFSGTIKENILFGKEYNEELYKKVLKACCLEKDMSLLVHGDLTLIGERGVNLSGGQKARLSVARAVYSESDIYLFDDPFAAVDSKVAREMFENGLRGELLKGKTLILVTHHLHFARDSDYVIVMNNGSIEAQGTFSELEMGNIELLNVFKGQQGEGNKKEEDQDDQTSGEIFNEDVKEGEKVIEEETTSVSWSTYIRYLKTIGTFWDLLQVIFLFCGYQAVTIYYTRLIGAWATEHTKFVLENPETNPLDFGHHYHYIKIAGALLIVIYLLSYLKRVKFVHFILSTNSALHQKMIQSLLRSKILFFDVNPIGRILNRFATDLGILDKPNIMNAYDLIHGLLHSVSLLLTVCMINPMLFLASGFIIYGLYKIKQYFSQPMISSKKLELASRSPIFSTVSSTLGGLTIIRVYSMGNRFVNNFLDLLYNNSKAFLFLFKTSRLFAVTLDAGIRGIMILGIMLFTLVVIWYKLESALVGLSLLFLLQIGEETGYVIRQTLSVDMNMQSAQRMLEYCEIDSEGVHENKLADMKIVEKRWPMEGQIEFNNVFLRYKSGLDYALNGLSFKVEGGCKVACVGRTGAGKSSIIQALFRMVEIEKEGWISIDGMNIKEIGLNLLRSKLSIIPQTPVVFSGTIRRNLDPFAEYTDAELWNALEEVSLKKMIMRLEKGLETDMTVSSSVFSVGQKQLICLARVILMKSKVLILDEATANVDMETDEFIQRKIMEKFAECTVLTIAHRLITIANYDKVIVMDKGRMVEFDSPYELLVEKVGDERISRREGIFVDMVKNTGSRMAEKIFGIARNCYMRKLLPIVDGPEIDGEMKNNSNVITKRHLE